MHNSLRFSQPDCGELCVASGVWCCPYKGRWTFHLIRLRQLLKHVKITDQPRCYLKLTSLCHEPESCVWVGPCRCSLHLVTWGVAEGNQGLSRSVASCPGRNLGVGSLAQCRLTARPWGTEKSSIRLTVAVGVAFT